MAKIYYEKDAPIAPLKGKRVAVIGYGSQGHAHSQNLRDSGVEVVVSELKDTPNYKLAVEHGFKPTNIKKAIEGAALIIITLPDQLQAKLYQTDIGPNLKAGQTLGFCHGFNIHFKYIVPPKDVNVVMIAPKGPGHLVRAEFEKGGGVPCLIAVQQDVDGTGKKIALAWGNGMGGARAGILETTFKEETETDLFGEQVVLCGGLTSLIKAGFETLVAAGYQPEVAYFECMHELKLIVDLMYRGGLNYMRYAVSDTAEHGDYTGGPKIVTDETRRAMARMLADIQDGHYANQWIAENEAGRPWFKAVRRREQQHPIEQVGARLRDMMPFLNPVCVTPDGAPPARVPEPAASVAQQSD